MLSSERTNESFILARKATRLMASLWKISHIILDHDSGQGLGRMRRKERVISHVLQCALVCTDLGLPIFSMYKLHKLSKDRVL